MITTPESTAARTSAVTAGSMTVPELTNSKSMANTTLSPYLKRHGRIQPCLARLSQGKMSSRSDACQGHIRCPTRSCATEEA